MSVCWKSSGILSTRYDHGFLLPQAAQKFPVLTLPHEHVHDPGAACTEGACDAVAGAVAVGAGAGGTIGSAGGINSGQDMIASILYSS